MGKLGKLGGIAKEVLEAISAKFAKATGGFDLFNLGAAGAGGLMQQMAGPGGVGGENANMVTLGSGGGSLKSMTDEQWKELAYIVSGEAERGTDDEYGVAAAVLNRVADPRFPSTTTTGLASMALAILYCMFCWCSCCANTLPPAIYLPTLPPLWLFTHCFQCSGGSSGGGVPLPLCSA